MSYQIYDICHNRQQQKEDFLKIFLEALFLPEKRRKKMKKYLPILEPAGIRVHFSSTLLRLAAKVRLLAENHIFLQ